MPPPPPPPPQDDDDKDAPPPSSSSSPRGPLAAQPSVRAGVRRRPRRRRRGHDPCATDEADRHEDPGNDDDDDDDDNCDGDGVESGAVPFHASLYSLCAALNSVNLGYDLGASTVAAPLVREAFNLTDARLELFLGSLNFWSIFGALINPILTDRYGRRRTFGMAAMMFVLGVAGTASARTFAGLMAGRMVVGLAVGCGEALDPMYIAEISPAQHRGQLVSWAEAGVAVGVMLGFCSSLPFVGRDVDGQWRYMLGMGAVMPCVMMGLVRWVMPESPRWLLTRAGEGNEEEARRILAETHPPGFEVDALIEEMKESLEVERTAATAVGWHAILVRPSPAVRRMLLVGVGVAIMQQAVGIDAIMFYLLMDIRRAGISSELAQLGALILLGLVKLIFVFVGARLFDEYGRRLLMIVSLLGCGASLVVVSISFMAHSQASEIVTVVALAAYLAFFSVGIGPGNWVVVSEVFATSIRAKAMCAAIFPNRVTATLMASTFLSVANALGWPGFFFMLASICAVSALFLYIYLPETMGKSLEEMSIYFAQITGDRSILDVEEKLHGGGGAELELTGSSSESRAHQSTDDEDCDLGQTENALEGIMT